MIRIGDIDVRAWEKCDSCIKEDVKVHLKIGISRDNCRTSRLCSNCLHDLNELLDDYFTMSVEEWEKR